ncbi:hypothetical protein BDZ89DRAFT_1141563 [Hymenopellis radicata]|nr:hypothetical protein BDZ89DRAFT_1141563 [Hymenopellis radicata]
MLLDKRVSPAIWAAIGKARNGQVDPSLSYGVALEPVASKTYEIEDYDRGIRAWGTGCNSGGANCAMSVQIYYPLHLHAHIMTPS